MAVQRKTFGGQFSPCTMWVPRVELRSSGLAANTSTQGAIIASNLKALMCHTHPNPEAGSYCAAQASLKFMFFLPQFPKSWDYRYTWPQPALPLTLSILDSRICFPSSTPNAKNNKSITWTNTLVISWFFPMKLQEPRSQALGSLWNSNNWANRWWRFSKLS